MVSYHIREYRPGDHETVRDLFATGMSEYVPTLCLHMLKQPWSLLLPILAITLLLAVGRSFHLSPFEKESFPPFFQDTQPPGILLTWRHESLG
uniref:Uncharacterized protein n=1 Tax=Pseudonaja textilis TaxID=8673 RepID=A0A670ZGZ1_PSETE